MQKGDQVCLHVTVEQREGSPARLRVHVAQKAQETGEERFIDE